MVAENRPKHVLDQKLRQAENFTELMVLSLVLEAASVPDLGIERNQNVIRINVE